MVKIHSLINKLWFLIFHFARVELIIIRFKWTYLKLYEILQLNFLFHLSIILKHE